MSDLRSEIRDIHSKLDQILARLDLQPATTAGASTTSDGTRFAQGSGEIREHESLPPFQRDPARLASIAERRAAKQAAEDTRRPTEGDPAP